MTKPDAGKFTRARVDQRSRMTPFEEQRIREMQSERQTFNLGEWVEKHSGEARYFGKIVSAYQTSKGGWRYVVEVWPQGFQMICTAGMLRPLQSSDGLRFGMFRGSIIIVHPEMPPHMWDGEKMVKIEMGEPK
jgi:hypothetical protein